MAYTYSKCMTNSIGYYGDKRSIGPYIGVFYWQNLYDGKAEWGPCYFDVTHMLTQLCGL